MYDTHVHTNFSHDGKSTMEEYAAIMKQAGIKGIGFTEHHDYSPDAAAYGKFDYDSFITGVSEYKSRGYEFYAGTELGYEFQTEGDILDGIRDKHFDYIIGSVHRIGRQTLSGKGFLNFIEAGGEYLPLIEKYYQQVSHSLKFKPYDVIAHIGIFKRYLDENYLNSPQLIELVKDMESELVIKCAQSDKLIEVNTSGLFSVLGETIPGNKFLTAYYSAGGRLISLGSDAHAAQNLAKGFDTAKEMLKNIGFKYIYLPWDKEHPILLNI